MGPVTTSSRSYARARTTKIMGQSPHARAASPEQARKAGRHSPAGRPKIRGAPWRTCVAGFGDNDIARVVGSNSYAFSGGGCDPTVIGDHDIATGADHLTAILPMLF